jgi:hypothetical protein
MIYKLTSSYSGRPVKKGALDVIAKLRGFGTVDPKPAIAGTVTTSANINIPAGSRSTPVQIKRIGRDHGAAASTSSGATRSLCRRRWQSLFIAP